MFVRVAVVVPSWNIPPQWIIDTGWVHRFRPGDGPVLEHVAAVHQEVASNTNGSLLFFGFAGFFSADSVPVPR